MHTLRSARRDAKNHNGLSSIEEQLSSTKATNFFWAALPSLALVTPHRMRTRVPDLLEDTASTSIPARSSWNPGEASRAGTNSS